MRPNNNEFVAAAGGRCGVVRDRHRGGSVRQQRRRVHLRASPTSAHVHQRVHHVSRRLRHRPLHVQPPRPAALPAHQSLGIYMPDRRGDLAGAARVRRFDIVWPCVGVNNVRTNIRVQ